MASQQLTESLRLAVLRPPSPPKLWKLIEAGERISAGTLLLASSPFLLLIAGLIAALSRRSPLIAHRRVGQGGRAIWVLKFRTMWDGGRHPWPGLIERVAETNVRIVPKSANDPRVTSRFAAICRHHSIDELPQLWNVLRGEMAFIGPRPLTRSELADYYAGDAAELLTRKPGLSGLWQIRGRSRLSYRQRRRLDLFLIRQWSVRLYARILVATVPCVLFGKNAW
ncbi:MAG TPA: sugar transferase [Candidatus Dormibacteraeota bacterium]|nr:sugar transferase [Candidatus Dormibacteraeota bacterium]